MVEKIVGFDTAKLSSKNCVSIGPDGHVLHHETLSPPEKQVSKFKMVLAISKLKIDPVEGPEARKLLNREGKVIVWLDSNSEKVLYIAEDSTP